MSVWHLLLTVRHPVIKSKNLFDAHYRSSYYEGRLIWIILDSGYFDVGFIWGIDLATCGATHPAVQTCDTFDTIHQHTFVFRKMSDMSDVYSQHAFRWLRSPLV